MENFEEAMYYLEYSLRLPGIILFGGFTFCFLIPFEIVLVIYDVIENINKLSDMVFILEDKHWPKCGKKFW